METQTIVLGNCELWGYQEINNTIPKSAMRWQKLLFLCSRLVSHYLGYAILILV